jgi:hypothetical protein
MKAGWLLQYLPHVVKEILAVFSVCFVIPLSLLLMGLFFMFSAAAFWVLSALITFFSIILFWTLPLMVLIILVFESFSWCYRKCVKFVSKMFS